MCKPPEFLNLRFVIHPNAADVADCDRWSTPRLINVVVVHHMSVRLHNFRVDIRKFDVTHIVGKMRSVPEQLVEIVCTVRARARYRTPRL